MLHVCRRRGAGVVRAAKELHFNKSGETLKRMQAGVDKLATVVGVTLGPKVRPRAACGRHPVDPLVASQQGASLRLRRIWITVGQRRRAAGAAARRSLWCHSRLHKIYGSLNQPSDLGGQESTAAACGEIMCSCARGAQAHAGAAGRALTASSIPRRLGARAGPQCGAGAEVR